MLPRFSVPGVFAPFNFSLFIIALSLLASSASVLLFAQAAQYQGRVVAVYDGDTLTLLTAEKQQVKVRLAEIDTPESKQPYGSRAKQALSELAFNKMAVVEVQDIDRYGRVVGRVYVQEEHKRVDVNAELVRSGAAWVYTQYAKDKNLFALEQEARKNKTGLWALPEAERTPPWKWRALQKKVTSKQLSTTKAQASDNTHFSCGQKTSCKQMLSCQEARFYLQECKLTSLDGDKDGIPCEALCTE